MIVGITGSFGTGKTTCAHYFKQLGAQIIDADRIAHQLIEPKKKAYPVRSPRHGIWRGSRLGRLTSNGAYRRVLAAFGERILSRNQQINRKRLAKSAFRNKHSLKKLNEILHPGIIKEIKIQIQQARNFKFIIIDAPLLIEAGLARIVDKIIAVRARSDIQKLRLKKKGFCLSEIKKRINLQMPLKKKLNLADFVIDNSGTKSETKKQVKMIWDVLNEEGRNGKDTSHK
ncbi:MAG: dephospho-CoA kinase [Candidatus Omnitrophica bacterium]|nr:dephospho-CoA kinase [Candidatus Omnitrophota bacterium]